LQIAFRKSDKNRDGVLNRREVNILMLQLGANVTEEQVIQIINYADVNGDGLISWAELEGAMQGAAASAQPRVVR
jgi:Ca2+-binding EF-hand superfamily protein